MRILFMADTPPDPDLGASGTEVQTIGALRKLGHEVDEVWAGDLSHRIRHGNLHYLLELPFEYRRVMMERMKKTAYDVVHVNQPHGYLAARSLQSSGLNSIFVHRSHGFEARAEDDLLPWREKFGEDGRNGLRRFASNVVSRLLDRHNAGIARYADGHIVYASQCGEYLARVYGVLPERILVSPPAAPDSYMNPIVPMNEGRLRNVLYVSQYAFFKAPMLVAQAFNALASNGDDIGLTWVCSEEHHPFVARMLAPEARRKVRMMGWMPQNELMDVYDRHGIFLFPSFYEGFGKVFLEAMTRGLCVIAADNSGAHDLIRDGVNGILVRTGDADALAERSRLLLNDPVLAGRISSHARRTAESFTWDRVGSEIASFYETRLTVKRPGMRHAAI